MIDLTEYINKGIDELASSLNIDRDTLIKQLTVTGTLVGLGLAGLAIFAILLSRSQASQQPPQQQPPPSTQPTIYFLPDRNLYPVLVNNIDKVQSGEWIKIHSYLLELTDDSSKTAAYAVSQALKRAKDRGAKLQLFFSNDGGTRPWHSYTVDFIRNQLKLQDLSSVSRTVDMEGYVLKTGIHAKNVILGQHYIQAGSANINNNGLYYNLEDTIVITNPMASSVGQKVYNKFVNYHNAYWTGQTSAISTTATGAGAVLDSPPLTPFDASASMSVTTTTGLWYQFINAVNNAKTRVYVSSYNSVNSAGVNTTVDQAIQAIINAKKRGVDVRVVVDGKHDTAKYLYNTMVSNGVPAKKIASPYGGIDHSKLWVVDNIVFVSSQNFDSSGIGNFGFMIQQQDILNAAVQRFNYLWSLA